MMPGGLPDPRELTLSELAEQGAAHVTEHALQCLDEMSAYINKARESVKAGRYIEAVGWISSVDVEDAQPIFMLASKERQDAMEAAAE